MAVVARAAGFVQLPPGSQGVCAGVGGGDFAGEIANRIIVVVLRIRSAHGIQAVEFVVGVVQRLTARGTAAEQALLLLFRNRCIWNFTDQAFEIIEQATNIRCNRWADAIVIVKIDIKLI